MAWTRRSLIATGCHLWAALSARLTWAASKPPATPSRIGFGSCARENRPQPIWDSIVEQKPDLFLMIGDNIYADTDDMDVMKAKYAQLAAKPGFAKLRQSCPILATWDDHDFGRNDAGEEYEHKAESQRIFADFFELADDAGPRHRPGVYDAHLFGPPERRIQIILLDTRYFRSSLVGRPKKNGDGVRPPYRPNEDESATLLGEAQWQWLQEQLKVPAKLRIVATSIQFVSDRHDWEKWNNFPHERQRLIDLIAKTKAGGCVFVSGDRHMAELSMLKPGVDGAPYPLYDLTSSGLNQGGGGRPDEPNPHRVYPLTQQTTFGQIDVDFDAAEPTVTFTARDSGGRTVIEHTVPLAALQPRG